MELCNQSCSFATDIFWDGAEAIQAEHPDTIFDSYEYHVDLVVSCVHLSGHLV